MAARGHHAEARLVRIQAAETGRHADRARKVAAEIGCRKAGGHRRRTTARGAARGAGGVVRIARCTVDRVIRLQILQEQRDIGLAEHHGTGGQQPFDGDRRVIRDAVLESGIAPGGLEAFDVEGFLDRHRQAVQWTPCFALLQRAVGRLGALARALEVPHDDRIERAVVLFDAVDVVIEKRERGDLSGAKFCRKCSGGRKSDVSGHGVRFNRFAGSRCRARLRRACRPGRTRRCRRPRWFCRRDARSLSRQDNRPPRGADSRCEG